MISICSELETKCAQLERALGAAIDELEYVKQQYRTAVGRFVCVKWLVDSVELFNDELSI